MPNKTGLAIATRPVLCYSMAVGGESRPSHRDRASVPIQGGYFMKRVVSIQDISCLGKCSLTVALPIISAMGVETCVVPTAVLSTHTGGFSGFTFHDLTQEVAPIADHWQRRASPLTPSTPGIWAPLSRSIWSANSLTVRWPGHPNLRGPRHGGQRRTLHWFYAGVCQGNGQAVWQSRCYCPQPHWRPPLCWGLTTWGRTTMKPISGIC